MHENNNDLDFTPHGQDPDPSRLKIAVLTLMAIAALYVLFILISALR